jgi:hypothetical protein
MNFDVFNGDADGICALVQLRLARPLESTLVTGLKRDIQLLQRVDAKAGDQVVALDISMDKNRDCLNKLLEQDVDVFYVDHHYPGEIPVHCRLKSLIDTNANTCTSLLVDQYLEGQFTAWAVVAAFGDNLSDSAIRAASRLNLLDKQLKQLEMLGICLNYNGYGASLDDLHFLPDSLYRQLVLYSSPLDFIADSRPVYDQLLSGYEDDMNRARSVKAEYQSNAVGLYILPDEKWARRVSGVWGNELANQNPDIAHAVLTHNVQGGYQVSVRAPLNNKTGADKLCSNFPSGGGRKAAAGINNLNEDHLSVFIEAFKEKYK